MRRHSKWGELGGFGGFFAYLVETTVHFGGFCGFGGNWWILGYYPSLYPLWGVTGILVGGCPRRGMKSWKKTLDDSSGGM